MNLRNRKMKTNNNINANDKVIDKIELIQTNTDYKRDSFDDRVCDDLSEVLLSYLSFKDKFGFECISKQWKSLIFNKQRNLCFKYETMALKTFKVILQKCKRIDSIDICYTIPRNISILSLITKHCNHIKSMRYDFSGIDGKTIASFGKKFGKSLQLLENNRKPEHEMQNIKSLFKFCNKLVSIKGINFEYMFEIKGNLLLITDRLESFHIEIGIVFNVKQFENFIDKYKQTVKVLSIEFINSDSVNEILVQLIKIENLKELNINLSINELSDNLDNSLALISDKCKKLVKLSFNGYCLSTALPFKIIKHFKQLKCLSIDSNLFSDRNGRHLSLKSFKNFINLIHLTVDSVETGYDFYDEYLPQLRDLKVIHEYHSIGFNENTFFLDFANLSNIEKLEIHDLFFKFNAFEYLINSRKRIQSIKWIFNNSKQRFTKRSIDSLISLAVERPEIEFRFDFIVSNPITSYWNQLLNKPNNIYIEFYDS